MIGHGNRKTDTEKKPLKLDKKNEYYKLYSVVKYSHANHVLNLPPTPHTMDFLSDLTRFFLALKFYILIHVFILLNFLFYLSLQLFTIRVRS